MKVPIETKVVLTVDRLFSTNPSKILTSKALRSTWIYLSNSHLTCLLDLLRIELEPTASAVGLDTASANSQSPITCRWNSSALRSVRATPPCSAAPEATCSMWTPSTDKLRSSRSSSRRMRRRSSLTTLEPTTAQISRPTFVTPTSTPCSSHRIWRRPRSRMNSLTSELERILNLNLN